MNGTMVTYYPFIAMHYKIQMNLTAMKILVLNYEL